MTKIRVRGLGKRYRIGTGVSRAPYRTLREDFRAVPGMLWRTLRRRNRQSSEFWALHDIDLDVKHGEVVGVVGRNGAGKSTLLKVLSRITAPTCGAAEVHGTLGSLLEVGTGFHPELTGRENIFLSGALLGMRRHEVRRHFDEIVSFAGVEKFLDTPCKHYSSGMYVRLAFAVAAHLDVDVLFLDEVLAVGDLEFQRRCLGRIRDRMDGNRTVLLVSHQLALIEHTCTRAVLIDEGRLALDGTPVAVFQKYREQLRLGGDATACLLNRPRCRRFSPVLSRVSILDHEGRASSAVSMGGSIAVQIEYQTQSLVRDAGFGLVISSADGVRVFLVNSEMAGTACPCAPAAGKAVCRIPNLPLLPGRYCLEVDYWQGGAHVDHVENALFFDVLPRDVFGTGRIPASDQGMIWQHSEWEVPVVRS